MPDDTRDIARLIEQLAGRVTDLEQGRPPDAPSRVVENVPDEAMTASDSVSETKRTDFLFKYDTPGNGYDTSEYP